MYSADESSEEEERRKGRHLTDPWDFRFFTTSDNARLMIVQERRAETMVPLIEEHIERISWIWSEEGDTYSCLSERRFTH